MSPAHPFMPSLQHDVEHPTPSYTAQYYYGTESTSTWQGQSLPQPGLYVGIAIPTSLGRCESVPPIPGSSSGVAWWPQSASYSPLESHAQGSRLPPSAQYPWPDSSSSRTSSSVPSISLPDVNIEQIGAVRHQITEDKSVSQRDLELLFPARARATQPTKWICQIPECSKVVRGQERLAHVLSHRGRRRYECKCGAGFSRSQDQRRHLREQATCRSWCVPLSYSYFVPSLMLSRLTVQDLLEGTGGMAPACNACSNSPRLEILACLMADESGHCSQRWSLW
ncbi:hypothetical protein JB92DRAFT_386204 [Gautieria morchelliformis]|nr:hypothetical protein JB92DRAFT_386204 [Gautieria morchelliformis]